MADPKLKRMGAETVTISQRGWLDDGWARIPLPQPVIPPQICEDKTEEPSFRTALAISPVQSEEYMKKMPDRIAAADSFCKLFFTDTDSFAAAERFSDDDSLPPLVLSFANAIRAGGGFRRGQPGQEPGLCRTSSLYLSLDSPEAQEMYAFNDACSEPCHSHYMILSPCVAVFREPNGEFLTDPFGAAVMSLPAPNTRRNAAEVSHAERKRVIQERLRRFLSAAAWYGYRTLILGAWGCGYFGNDPYDVASSFKKLLIDEKFGRLFDRVVFAIPDASMMEIFSDELMPGRTEGKPKPAARSGLASRWKFPALAPWHDSSDMPLTSYMEGIMADGCPFAAAVTGSAERNLLLCMPAAANETNDGGLSGESAVAADKETDPRTMKIFGCTFSAQKVNDDNVRTWLSRLEDNGFAIADVSLCSVMHGLDLADSPVALVLMPMVQNGKHMVHVPQEFAHVLR